MSIPHDILLAEVGAERLFPLMPLSPRAQLRRALFVTKEIWDLLESNTHDEIEELRYGALRADLEQFVTAEKLPPKYLYWLTKRDDLVWEIRSVADEPSLRVLGRFADKDVFVALTIEERSELEGWMTEQWKRAIRTCVQRWNTLFTYHPHGGGQASDFFTGTISGSYFKK